MKAVMISRLNKANFDLIANFEVRLIGCHQIITPQLPGQFHSLATISNPPRSGPFTAPATSSIGMLMSPMRDPAPDW
jgi:hypothetical protein